MNLVECRYTAGPNVKDVGPDVPRWVDPTTGTVYEDGYGTREASTVPHLLDGDVYRSTAGGSKGVLTPVKPTAISGVVGALATQVGGNHYKGMKIQPVEFIVANDIPYREANAIKYLCRHKNKNGLQDLEKALHYVQMLIEEAKANGI